MEDFVLFLGTTPIRKLRETVKQFLTTQNLRYKTTLQNAGCQGKGKILIVGFKKIQENQRKTFVTWLTEKNIHWMVG